MRPLHFSSFEKDDQFGIIIIEDNTGGIPKSILAKIFDEHFTTKGEKGNGLGLAMTKNIIEVSRFGKLEVVNTKGGARFSIYLPLHKNES